ncbi:mannose-1-phosphate guanylyltransferase [Roseivivax sp. CAU 1761]
MSDQKIHPIVLSGGMGTRLWPMSRVHQPKQFQPIDGTGSPSFLQDTALRHRGPEYHDPLLVASASEEELIFKQLGEIDVAGRFIGEPKGRNTGPAVLAAALHLAETDPEALLLVLPSDHRIQGSMRDTVMAARQAARDGWIVLFGIVPRSPETGFGYITAGTALEGMSDISRVARFVEKPDLAHAEALVAGGETFWASGISMMRADILIDEFARHAPDTLAAVRAAHAAARPVAHGHVLGAEAFADAENEPTERLIFERTDRVAVAPSSVHWSDVGAWTAIHSIGDKSESGNVESGEVVTLDTRNSLIRAGDKLVTVIGMEDLIVVDTPDALLVTNHAHAQMVKDAVNKLKAENRREVMTHRETSPLGGNDVAAHNVPSGRALRVVGGEPAGAILAVVSGEAAVLNGSKTGPKSAGAHLSVGPGETMLVENHGESDLRLITIELSQDTRTELTLAQAGEPGRWGRASA